MHAIPNATGDMLRFSENVVHMNKTFQLLNNGQPIISLE
jgi:hypothetical protein